MSRPIPHYPLDSTNRQGWTTNGFATYSKVPCVQLENPNYSTGMNNENYPGYVGIPGVDSSKPYRETSDKTSGFLAPQTKSLFPYKNILFVFKRVEEWIELYNRWTMFGRMWRLDSTEEILEAILDSSLALPYRIKIPSNLGQNNSQSFNKTIVLTFSNDAHFCRFNSKWLHFRERFSAYDNTMSFTLSMDMILGIIPYHFLVHSKDIESSQGGLDADIQISKNHCCDDINCNREELRPQSDSEDIVLDLSSKNHGLKNSQVIATDQISEDSSDTIIIDQLVHSDNSDNELVIDLSVRFSDESTKTGIANSEPESIISSSDVPPSIPESSISRKRRRKSPPQKRPRLVIASEQDLTPRSDHESDISRISVDDATSEHAVQHQSPSNRESICWTDESTSEHKDMNVEQFDHRDNSRTVSSAKFANLESHPETDNINNGTKPLTMCLSEKAILAVINCHEKCQPGSNDVHVEQEILLDKYLQKCNNTDIHSSSVSMPNLIQNKYLTDLNMRAPHTLEDNISSEATQKNYQMIRHKESSSQEACRAHSEAPKIQYSNLPTQVPYRDVQDSNLPTLTPNVKIKPDHSVVSTKNIPTSITKAKYFSAPTGTLLEKLGVISAITGDLPEQPRFVNPPILNGSQLAQPVRSDLEMVSPPVGKCSNSSDFTTDLPSNVCTHLGQKVKEDSSDSGTGFQARLSEFLVGDLQVVNQLSQTILDHTDTKRCRSSLNIYSVCLKSSTWIEFYLVCDNRHAYQINFCYKMVDDHCYVYA